jgi:hypothetical protein
MSNAIVTKREQPTKQSGQICQCQAAQTQGTQLTLRSTTPSSAPVLLALLFFDFFGESLFWLLCSAPMPRESTSPPYPLLLLLFDSSHKPASLMFHKPVRTASVSTQ